MKLITDLGTRRWKDGEMRRRGIFKCQICGESVERFSHVGHRNKTCGCIRRQNRQNPLRKTRLYSSWRAMIGRCTNKNTSRYDCYGGRGISVCSEWLDFDTFCDWVIANGYKDDLQIDRINNDGNYEPSNCRYVDSKTNMRNSRTTKLTGEIVAEIKKIHLTKKSGYHKTAVKYGVTDCTIWMIASGKNWGDIKPNN